MALRTLARRRIGRIRHVKWPTPKHIENSLRGIAYAARHGYDAIDIDMQITSDRVIVGTHWARPMKRDGFHDPDHKIPRYRTVRRMTWVQVHRLIAPKRYRIVRIERLLRACARRGVTALLEPKGDPRFREDWPWQHIAAVADDCGATVSVRALRENRAALTPARRAGFEAWEI
jgi:glycerophosphoryl diester phosphodiesterase